MPLTKAKKFAPTDVVVAWQSGATDDYAWRKGERLHGTHPAVEKMGAAAFVADGTPESEWPSMFDAIVADNEAEAKRAPKPAKPHFDAKAPIGEFLIAHVGVIASKAGAIPEGTVVHRDDPRAKAVPEVFSPLIDKLTRPIPTGELQAVAYTRPIPSGMPAPTSYE
jgi:hypothetical protein